MVLPLIVGTLAVVAVGSLAASRVIGAVSKLSERRDDRRLWRAGTTFCSPHMPPDEARLVLGFTLRERIAAADVKRRHRQLMILNHPDNRGSPYLAMKIQEAKSVLLNQLSSASSASSASSSASSSSSCSPSPTYARFFAPSFDVDALVARHRPPFVAVDGGE